MNQRHEFKLTEHLALIQTKYLFYDVYINNDSKPRINIFQTPVCINKYVHIPSDMNA